MSGESEFDAHFQEGLRKFNSGKFAESLSEFFNAAYINPTSAQLHYYIGEALERYRKQSGIKTGTHPSEAEERKRRHAPRYKSRIPIIVVAYDVNGAFFAELATTAVTSVKGASIEMRRSVKLGAQLMIFTVDSEHAVPAVVRNLRTSESEDRHTIGVEFLRKPIEWLLPPTEESEENR